ncbi:MAG: transketolase [Ignavibacteriae bacterium]|nr:transketolase [Ignavibacteriota bacterium]MCB9242953.1 transketolase [Ignavibacteriales bacterium]
MSKANQKSGKQTNKADKNFDQYKNEVIADYKLAVESREASLLGRKEVLTGKAKFGIFGDGKEIAQLAMAKAFKKGDFRSGYYRDQTFAFATDMFTIKEWFAQLYADTDVEHDPASAGRMMNSHFATRSLDEKGNWKNLMEIKNSSPDISPTASQMQRLLGLAYASKLYRNNEQLHSMTEFTDKGNEVAFGTIGNASCAEGMFFETINAAAVLMVPMAISIWDDGYGISVPNKYQVAKSNISEVLKGYEYDEESGQGFKIYIGKGWDYEGLCKIYEEGIQVCREKHIPVMFHIQEVTQPQGHSTSGSHERYKSPERLQWEKDMDCITKMREWMLSNAIAEEKELDEIEAEAKKFVKESQKQAWDEFLDPIKKDANETGELFLAVADKSTAKDDIKVVYDSLKNSLDKNRKVISSAVMDVLRLSRNDDTPERNSLIDWYNEFNKKNFERYSSYLYSESEHNALSVPEVKPVYSDGAERLNGSEVLNAFFMKAFERDPRIFAIGEDIGKLGDVNQGMVGIQEKFGDLRLTDTGIREATIVGQGIGSAMRGLKPIIEIQYLDYLLYGLQIISDDLATVLYRTKGGQKAPMIVRTRGHRLEGIWHSGSPMSAVLGSFRGLYVCVPRNMTKAAGFYNTLLQSDEPGLIVERLNAYRLKEALPDNIGDITVPLGVPEVVKEGTDITIVTYGACVDIVSDAVNKLDDVNISCEIIDVQTLIPFDINAVIKKSLKKTNRVLFVDEDVPGGASAYMMQKVVDEQEGWRYLDSKPSCLPGQEHRPAYGTDGDYFSKPNAEDVFRAVYNIMNEADPSSYPMFY